MHQDPTQQGTLAAQECTHFPSKRDEWCAVSVRIHAIHLPHRLGHEAAVSTKIAEENPSKDLNFATATDVIC
eukprot:4861616-Amphidinium_carterae.1